MIAPYCCLLNDVYPVIVSVERVFSAVWLDDMKLCIPDRIVWPVTTKVNTSRYKSIDTTNQQCYWISVKNVYDKVIHINFDYTFTQPFSDLYYR